MAQLASAAPFRFHRAWIILTILVVVQVIGQAISMSAGIMVPLLKDPAGDFGWNIALISGAVAVYYLVGALFSPVAGMLGDPFRFPPYYVRLRRAVPREYGPGGAGHRSLALLHFLRRAACHHAGLYIRALTGVRWWMVPSATWAGHRAIAGSGWNRRRPIGPGSGLVAGIGRLARNFLVHRLLRRRADYRVQCFLSAPFLPMSTSPPTAPRARTRRKSHRPKSCSSCASRFLGST